MSLFVTFTTLLSLDRSLLLAELEKEEKEKDWYYAQLQNLTKRIDSLPLTENVRACGGWGGQSDGGPPSSPLNAKFALTSLKKIMLSQSLNKTWVDDVVVV